jgi:transcription elongation factor Elf1
MIDKVDVKALNCPACGHVDLDFEHVAHTHYRCSICGAVIEVEEKKAFEGTPVGTVVELSGKIIDAA